MARRKWDQTTLMKATEHLLLERGYHGFHFGALIDQLAIKRTTMYDHFRDKDDLIIAYADFTMEQMLIECNKWEPEGEPFRDLIGLLHVLTPYAPFLGLFPTLRPIHPPLGVDDVRIERIQEKESELQQMIFDAVGQGQWSGVIRKDISAKQLTELLFHGLRYLDAHVAMDVLVSGMRKIT